MNFKFNKDDSSEEEFEEEFEEEVVEEVKSATLKEMFPQIEWLQNTIKKGSEEQIKELCTIAGIEKTDSVMGDLCKAWRNSS